MPIGILQYPFYDPKMSIDENLAAVGTVIGHELGHGIDDQGSRYDSDGKQRLWMEMKDLAEFSKRKEKLVAQFEQAKHNGNLTLGENIGDLVGLTSSLQQAQMDPEFMKNPERIKNFFVGYARLWCEVKRPKFIENQLKTNPHSLGVARVNEQIKQQIDFKNVYQCKDTDAMVLPKDKLVHIW
jgi:putative endopeptidase